MTLYEINEQILSCVDMETGEILDSEKLDSLQLEREKKIEGSGLWLKNLKAEVIALKAEEKAFKERRETAEKNIDGLKRWLAYALNGQKFETPRLKISYKASEVLDIAPDAIVPDEYMRYKEPEINKAELKKAVKDGLEIEGVELIKKNNIQIK